MRSAHCISVFPVSSTAMPTHDGGKHINAHCDFETTGMNVREERKAGATHACFCRRTPLTAVDDCASPDDKEVDTKSVDRTNLIHLILFRCIFVVMLFTIYRKFTEKTMLLQFAFNSDVRLTTLLNYGLTYSLYLI